MHRWICPKLAACALALSTVPVLAQDHLVPEPSSIGGGDYVGTYQAQVATVFRDIYDRKVRVRMIAEPSFSAEYAVGIRDDPNPRIFVVTPTRQIWQYQSLEDLKNGSATIVDQKSKEIQASEIARLSESLPPDPRQVKLDHCEITIDPKLADQIADVWKEMLLQTRYVRGPEPVKGPDGKMMETVVIGVDGEFYHFSMRSDFDELAGETWSPDEITKPAKLVEIAETMRAYCQARKSGDLAKLSRETDELLSELKSHP